MPIGVELDESLEDTMRETLSGISEDQPVIDEVVDDEPIEEVTEDGRERDDQGRFVAQKKEEPKEPVAAIQPAPDDAGVEGVEGIAPGDEEIPADDAETVAPELINPPNTWTAQAKSKWGELPNWAKAEVLKRETESYQGVQKVAEKAAYADRLEDIVSPYKAAITAEGSTPEQTIQGMLNTAYLLRGNDPNQKVMMAVEMASKYGFINELFAHFTQTGQNNQQQAFNPATMQLQQEVDGLKQTLQQQQEQQQSAEQNEAVSAVQAFATEAKEDGSLVHPYYENVRELMGILLESGKQQTLDGAYNAALWMSEDTRGLLQSQQQSEGEQKRQSEAAERATKAKRAKTVAISSSGTHDSGTPNQPTGSVEDTMRETLANMKS